MTIKPTHRPTTPCAIDETMKTAAAALAFLVQVFRLLDSVRDFAG